MDARPILLVQQDPPPPGESSLGATALGFTRVTAQQAIQRVAARQADVVICGRFPGWQALVARVAGSGGACILWGAPPTPAELGQLFQTELETASEPAELFRAVQNARVRLADADESARADEFERRVQIAKRIGRFAQSIAAQIDLPNVVQEAIGRARELCEADAASLLLVDAATGELCFEVVAGGSALVAQLRLKPGQGIAGKVAQCARSMRVEDAASVSDASASFDRQTGFRTGSVIATPLLLNGDVIGVLEAVRETGKVAFDAESLERLEELAPHVSIAVHNAQVSAKLRESQAKVLEANAQLEQKVRQRTAQIARGKREWELTFDAISEPIAQLDGHVVQRVNRAWAEAAGVPITEAAGKKCYELFAGRSAPCPGCPLEAPSGERAQAELEFPKGTRYRLSRFHMSDTPGESRAVVHYRDVTREHAMEAKLREQERMVALSRLADGAAHEINNPLAFVTSNLNALKRVAEDLESVSEVLGEAAAHAEAGRMAQVVAGVKEAARTITAEDAAEWREMLGESLHGAQRVAEIVRALRALSRQEKISTQPSDVNAVIARTARAELEGAAVDLQLGATRHARIAALHLEQVLGAILRNARQAVSPGQRVTVTSSDGARCIEIEVRDEGCGIPPENLNRVFEPFFTTRKLGQGLGLGLTAAWGVITRCGGEIALSSQPGEGTVVVVRVPSAAPVTTGDLAIDPVGAN